MRKALFFTFFLLIFIGSDQTSGNNPQEKAMPPAKGALLTSRFKSFEELKKVINIEYFQVEHGIRSKPFVRLTHSNDGSKVTSILKPGVDETGLLYARDNGFWARVGLALNSPYFVIKRNDILRIFILSRRRERIFGEGDISFYDLALTMLDHIDEDDIAFASSEDLSEKGFINTFNHISAQAFMTSIFSEKLADFIADMHERAHMPELITGEFTNEQLMNIETGAIDNYVDIINNEWGQKLGKELRKKFNISRETYWTPELLADYLNEIQGYYSFVFQIGFEPFRPSDIVVTRFSYKINALMEDVSGMR